MIVTTSFLDLIKIRALMHTHIGWNYLFMRDGALINNKAALLMLLSVAICMNQIHLVRVIKKNQVIYMRFIDRLFAPSMVLCLCIKMIQSCMVYVDRSVIFPLVVGCS
jgi:hypothetical protein